MTDARLTQEAVEEWAQPNAQAQVTQLAAEEWGAVVSGARFALLTQMGLEVWTNTPLITTGGLVKVWGAPGTPGAWAEKPLKVWTGSAWAAKPLRVWTGSAWVLA